MSQDRYNKRKNKQQNKNHKFECYEDQNYDSHRKHKDFKIKKRNLKEQNYNIDYNDIEKEYK